MTPVCALTPKGSASSSLTSSPKARIDAGSYGGTEEKCEVQAWPSANQWRFLVLHCIKWLQE